jgi:hypothetical protein
MSNPDAIPSRGDAVVVPAYSRKLRDTPDVASPPDCLGGRPFTDDLDAMEAQR